MSNWLKMFILPFILASSVPADTINSNDKRIFELYAQAALYEFCNKYVGDQCNEINTRLDTLEPEIFFFQNTEKKEVLIIYTLNNYYPKVILRYDKDGNLIIFSKGIVGLDKKEYIKGFMECGDPSGDYHAE